MLRVKHIAISDEFSVEMIGDWSLQYNLLCAPAVVRVDDCVYQGLLVVAIPPIFSAALRRCRNQLELNRMAEEEVPWMQVSLKDTVLLNRIRYGKRGRKPPVRRKTMTGGMSRVSRMVAASA